jgi:predicted benzoate:H+ symporter BenE
MSRLSRPSSIFGLVLVAAGLFLVARSSHFWGMIFGTFVLLVLFWGVRL